MTFCARCGEEARADARFCSGCGSALRAPTVADSSLSMQPRDPPRLSANSFPQEGGRALRRPVLHRSAPTDRPPVQVTQARPRPPGARSQPISAKPGARDVRKYGDGSRSLSSTSSGPPSRVVSAAGRVSKEQIRREAGYLYYLGRDGYLWKTPTKFNSSGRKARVGTEKIVREDGYMYFLDMEGFLARLPMQREVPSAPAGTGARMATLNIAIATDPGQREAVMKRIQMVPGVTEVKLQGEYEPLDLAVRLEAPQMTRALEIMREVCKIPGVAYSASL